MNISAIDWAIVAAYFLLSTVIGLMFTKRGGNFDPTDCDH